MIYPKLNYHVRKAIADNKFDLDLDYLTDDQIRELNYMSADELFQAWCTWQGFIGWASGIHEVHEAIYGGPDKLLAGLDETIRSSR